LEGARERSYRVINRLGGVAVTPGAADFRLLDQRALRALNELWSLRIPAWAHPWLGFPEARIEYEVAERFAGRSKYDLTRMLRLALDGILSFSVLPLRLIALLGLVTTFVGVAYGIFALVALIMGRVQTGWTSVVVLVLVFGGVQLLPGHRGSTWAGPTKRRSAGPA
jgi:dolichol-phosphate mannosyltransferase